MEEICDFAIASFFRKMFWHHKDVSEGQTFITVRKRNCGKVIFLHLSFSHSVHRGHGGRSVLVHAAIHPPWQTPPQQTATAADGTHPTGMHSCFRCIVGTFFFISSDVILTILIKKVIIC